MTLIRLLCWFCSLALFGQGFTLPAQSFSVYDSPEHTISGSTAHLPISETPYDSHHNHHSEELIQPRTESHIDHTQTASSFEPQKHNCQNNKTSIKPTPQLDMAKADKPNCCSDGNCEMNCKHQNGNMPCSIGCEPVQVNTFMLVSELTCGYTTVIASEPPLHFEYWRDSPPLSLPTPPPKFT